MFPLIAYAHIVSQASNSPNHFFTTSFNWTWVLHSEKYLWLLLICLIYFFVPYFKVYCHSLCHFPKCFSLLYLLPLDINVLAIWLSVLKMNPFSFISWYSRTARIRYCQIFLNSWLSHLKAVIYHNFNCRCTPDVK